MLWSKHTDGLTTDVDTQRGRVTLRGTADSAIAKDFALRLALNTRGVTTVDNQLMVVIPQTTVASTVKKTTKTTGQGISDSWITAKVKSTFLYSSNVDGNDITVNTSGGVVTLSGKVSSGAERALAIELAKNVRGVHHVNAKLLRH